MTTLLQLLKDTKLGMIDESLYDLLLLVSNSEARQEIGQLMTLTINSTPNGKLSLTTNSTPNRKLSMSMLKDSILN